MKFNFSLKRKAKAPKHKHKPEKQKVNRFVIISAPRTGSNLLCGALDAHPEIICHYELFHKEAIYHSSKYGNDWISNYTVSKRNKSPNDFLDFICCFKSSCNGFNNANAANTFK